MLAGSEKIVEAVEEFPKYRSRIRNDSIWICCPIHSGGQESTPSRRINIGNEKFRLGTNHCYACSEKQTMSWKELATLCGFKYPNIAGDADYASTLRVEETDILGLSSKKEANSLPWPKDRKWRGIKGSLISKLGGTMTILYGNWRMNMPVSIHEEIIGNVRCALEDTDKLKYSIDSPGWTKRALFPYDYFKKEKPRIIGLGEGLRDSLNPTQYGLPTMCIFGAGNWSKKKANLLADLEPDIIVDMLDNDKAGREVASKIRKDVELFANVKRIKLPEGGDPGALTKNAILKLKDKLEDML